jgi:hypothetical protein
MLDDLGRWAKRSYIRTRANGLAGASKSLFQLYRGFWRPGSFVPRGTNVFDREWDVLVILDSCRVDLMREVADEYDCIGDVASIRSVGSDSPEWIRKTFTEEYEREIGNTAYVTANPFSEGALPVNRESFAMLDEVWKYGFDDSIGTIPPEVVTDRAIRVGRTRDVDRVLVHYMQPHHPFIGEGSPLRDASSIERSINRRTDGIQAWEPGDIGRDAVWRMYRRGEITRDELWDSYSKTLHHVLDSVELLLDNFNADRAVLSSDHGNSMGEWLMYGHSTGFLHPSVMRVPWVETSGTDTHTYDPFIQMEDGTDRDVKDVLNALGYVA